MKTVIAEREARQVIESQCRFCMCFCFCCFCDAGQGYVKRAGLNQYERRAGHPCNLNFEAEAACWLEGLAEGTQQQPRGKEASSSKTQECLLTCNRSSQKDDRKLDSKEVTVPCNICRKQRL